MPTDVASVDSVGRSAGASGACVAVSGGSWVWGMYVLDLDHDSGSHHEVLSDAVVSGEPVCEAGGFVVEAMELGVRGLRADGGGRS